LFIFRPGRILRTIAKSNPAFDPELFSSRKAEFDR